MVVVAAVSYWRSHGAKVLTATYLVSLIVCQGNAWNQVVAGRINRAIYTALVEHKAQILRSDCVLIDQYSFAKRIPYTWVSDPHNQLDTYWGVAGLLGRGFPFLVHLALGEQKPVHIVRSEIEDKNGQLVFKFYNGGTYQLEEQTVPEQGSFTIDYDFVYRDARKTWK